MKTYLTILMSAVSLLVAQDSMAEDKIVYLGAPATEVWICTVTSSHFSNSISSSGRSKAEALLGLDPNLLTGDNLVNCGKYF